MEGEKLLVGESKILTVKVQFSSEVTSQPENVESSIEVTLDFSQKESTPSVTEIDATYHEEYYTCSAGTLEGTRCKIVTQDIKSATLACPSGYVEIDGVCYEEVDLSRRQCTGFPENEWDDTLGVCYNTESTSSKTGTCLSGYTYNSSAKNCQKDVTTYQAATHHEAYYSCPEGYNLQGTKCIK